MTSASGSVSFNPSQLLGGSAGKIDTDALIDALMAAKTIPQNQLKDQLASQQKLSDNLQEMNRRMQAITTAALSLTDLSFDGIPTKATSSLTSVVASSTGGAAAGSATFHVAETAAAQVSTVKADATGSWINDYTQGITVTVGSGSAVQVNLASGSATDIAAAVNGANLGIRAAVVNTDSGQVLQFTATKTGVANGFSISGLTQNVTGAAPTSDPTTVTSARDAQISVGDPAAGGYTISSPTNTFTNAMSGVTFTVSDAAKNQDVTITVDDDVSALSSKMQALVDAINSAKGGVKTLTAKGGLFQGDSTMNGIGFDLANAISSGVGGKSLTEYGIDMDKDGVVSFDASAFAAAYQADPSGTLGAVGSGGFATTMRQIGDAASTPVIGTLSEAITSEQGKIDDLNTQISNWDDRLAKQKDQLVLKYTAMQTALAKLQSTGDWLTNMFKSITDGQSNNN
jgi:flagellar hook-associated protein 2